MEAAAQPAALSKKATAIARTCFLRVTHLGEAMTVVYDASIIGVGRVFERWVICFLGLSD